MLAVFLYWGWDTVLAVNEESEDSRTMPGVSAVLNTLILVVMYVLITAVMQAYHGPAFLANNPNDVFSPIAHDVMGGTWDKLVFLCIFTSGAASALTTLLPLTRQTLSMAAHKSLPASLRPHPPQVHDAVLGHHHPHLAVDPLVRALTWWNVNALYDAISALGIMVCIAYGGTGLAATVYYRKELLKSAKNFFLMGVAPTLGAIMFAAILVKVIHDDYPYNSGNGKSYTGIHGIGGVFLMAVGTMLLGVVLMVIMWVASPSSSSAGPRPGPAKASRSPTPKSASATDRRPRNKPSAGRRTAAAGARRSRRRPRVARAPRRRQVSLRATRVHVSRRRAVGTVTNMTGSGSCGIRRCQRRRVYSAIAI